MGELRYIEERLGFVLYVGYDGSDWLHGYIYRPEGDDQRIHYKLSLSTDPELIRVRNQRGQPQGRINTTSWWEDWRYADSSETCRALEDELKEMVEQMLSALEVLRQHWSRPPELIMPIPRTGSEPARLHHYIKPILEARHEHS